jgi:GNAT superfamily N-acetyltransferase
LKFRIANQHDIIEINNLVNSAYRGEFAKQGWTTEADILDGQRTDCQAIREIIESQESFLLLLFDPSLVASVNLKKMGYKFYLGMLTVRPDLQAKGYGQKLLVAAEAKAKEAGAKQMELEVISRRQELINWYLRRGYQLSQERRPFPMTDPRFGIPKVDDLEFVVLNKNL